MRSGSIRGDVALGDVKQNNEYEHGDILLSRNDMPKASAGYGVLPISGDAGYINLPIS